MLGALSGDHRGLSRFYYLDVPFEETLRRHATRPQAGEFGRVEMRAWYADRDLLPGGVEEVIGPESTLEASVERVMADIGLLAPPPRRPR